MARKSTKPKGDETENQVEARKSEYVVVARRYRPQQFTELVGHEAIAQTLSNAIKTGRLAQAYVFTGTRGVGKTTTARILAKALNCKNGPTITPCDECASCKAIAAGEDNDVLEIDGASNNKVDEIRVLIQNSQYRPQNSRFKIYIIDEVHMLSISAFNALLKTLEEPPSHVKFIFATTEVQKLPAPILSRCQRFDLKGISREAITKRLTEIVNSENREAEPAALQLIARRAAGSMRDAQSLLDQALAFSSDKLSLIQLHSLLGQASEDQVAGLAKSVLARDVEATLREFQKQTEAGVQMGELLDQFLELWRQFVLFGMLRGGERPSDLFDVDLTSFTDSLKNWNADELMAGMDVLVSTKTRLRNTGQAVLLFEMALIRLCRLSGLVSVSELVKRLEGVSRGEVSAPTINRSMASASRIISTTPKAASAESKPESVQVDWKAENIPAIWSAILAQSDIGLRSALAQSSMQSFRYPNQLVLSFPGENQRYRDICQESARLTKLEAMVRQITGLTIAIHFDLDAQAATKPAPKQVSGAALREAVAKDPLVNAAMSELGAQLIRADEGFGST